MAAAAPPVPRFAEAVAQLRAIGADDLADELARIVPLLERAGLSGGEWSRKRIVRQLGRILVRLNRQLYALLGWWVLPEWCESCDAEPWEVLALLAGLDLDEHQGHDHDAPELPPVYCWRRPPAARPPIELAHRSTLPTHGPPATAGRSLSARPRRSPLLA